MDESVSVDVIIGKIPRSWKDCKHHLKHKEEFSLVELDNRLRIEVSLRGQEKVCANNDKHHVRPS